MKKLPPLLLLLTASLPSFADTTYMGVDYVLTDIDLAGESAKPNAAALRIGVSNNNMAFEAQYLTTNSTKNIYRIEFDLEQSVGLYFVMQSDVRNGFGVDVSVGYAMTDLTVSGPDGTYSGEDHYNDFSWGVAIHQQIPYFEKAQVKLGYQSLYKDSAIDISGISLGFTYQF